MNNEPREAENLQYEESQVIIFHEKLGRRKIDRYIINIALAYQKLGHKVRILTSQYERHDCITDIRVFIFNIINL